MKNGYSVQPNALPLDLGNLLWDQSHKPDVTIFKPASIGRNSDTQTNTDVRSDAISWIDGNTDTGRAWLDWIEGFQSCLNRRLLLGLYSFESHYSLFKPGSFYGRHKDAFRGKKNRLLSLVIYLNRDWVEVNAGQLVLYTGHKYLEQQIIAPEFGTIVVFLSDEFPHEVLTTQTDRHSIAGWFRANDGGMSH